MTTSLAQFEAWCSTEWKDLTGTFESDEQAVMALLAPLGKQILAAATSVGAATVQDGLTVLVNAAKAGVAAGAPLALAGNVLGATAAAETTFLFSVETNGITVIKNAESGLIKAAVAVAQTAVSELPTPTDPATAS